jgi:hypothetical protein
MYQVSEGFANGLNLERSVDTDRVERAPAEVSEVEDVAPYYKRRSAGVWACLASLSLVLAVVVGYGYNILEQEDMQIEQVPGMAKSISAIGQHVGNVEKRLADARVDQQNLAAQIQKVGAQSQMALNVTQQQTEAMIARTQETVFRHLNQQTGPLQPALAQLMRERTADRARLAQLEQQLLQARYEIASTKRDYTRQVESFRELQDELHHEIASLSNSSPAPSLNADVQADHEVASARGDSSRTSTVQDRPQSIDGSVVPATGSK